MTYTVGLRRNQIIFFEDDASRFVTGYGVFKGATSKNAKMVFRGAVEKYILPKQVIVRSWDTNSLVFLGKPMLIQSQMSFNRFLRDVGVEHVKARVGHYLQSNMEKTSDTISRLYRYFGRERLNTVALKCRVCVYVSTVVKHPFKPLLGRCI